MFRIDLVWRILFPLGFEHLVNTFDNRFALCRVELGYTLRGRIATHRWPKGEHHTRDYR